MLQQLYDDEIDEDTLKEYGGEIIDEQEDLNEPMNFRAKEFRGRPEAANDDDEDEDEPQGSSTLDEFMRLQNQMAAERVK